MLYIPPEQAKPSRIQGTFLSDKDTKNLVDFLKKSSQKVEYTEAVTNKYTAIVPGQKGFATEEEDIDNLFCRSRSGSLPLQPRLCFSVAAPFIDWLCPRCQDFGSVGAIRSYWPGRRRQTPGYFNF